MPWFKVKTRVQIEAEQTMWLERPEGFELPAEEDRDEVLTDSEKDYCIKQVKLEQLTHEVLVDEILERK